MPGWQHCQVEHPVLQVGGGTFALRGDLWVQNTYDITAGRDLTVRSGLLAHSLQKHLGDISIPARGPRLIACPLVETFHRHLDQARCHPANGYLRSNHLPVCNAGATVDAYMSMWP